MYCWIVLSFIFSIFDNILHYFLNKMLRVRAKTLYFLALYIYAVCFISGMHALHKQKTSLSDHGLSSVFVRALRQPQL